MLTKQIREQTIEHIRGEPRLFVCRHDGASQFFAFWKAYPSRRPHGNPRKPAQQAFETAIKRGIDHAAIIRGAENYRTAVEREGTEPRYIPHAVTWLRQERWSDHREVPEPPRLRVGMI